MDATPSQKEYDRYLSLDKYPAYLTLSYRQPEPLASPLEGYQVQRIDCRLCDNREVDRPDLYILSPHHDG